MNVSDLFFNYLSITDPDRDPCQMKNGFHTIHTRHLLQRSHQ